MRTTPVSAYAGDLGGSAPEVVQDDVVTVSLGVDERLRQRVVGDRGVDHHVGADGLHLSRSWSSSRPAPTIRPARAADHLYRELPGDLCRAKTLRKG